jgi:23S rRNA (guanosine2251-2'-O)-methyltransferase
MQKLKNEELARISAEAYRDSVKTPIIIVLDNIRSMNNIGSAFRTADSFLIEEILLIGITAQPPHREINKTALGATESVPWQYFAESTEAIDYLRRKNYQVMAIEQAHESTKLQNFYPQAETRYALVFGNEVKGISDEVMSQIDGCIEIPQKGTKHSLNISVSLGIVLWDFAQKMKIF